MHLALHVVVGVLVLLRMAQLDPAVPLCTVIVLVSAQLLLG